MRGEEENERAIRTGGYDIGIEDALKEAADVKRQTRFAVRMQAYLSLPNELLHNIIEHIAYVPTTLPVSPRPLPNSLSQRASPELLSLSIANQRLRRICLPFLFANLKIKDDEDATNMQEYLVLFSKFTKVLTIGSIGYVSKTATEIIVSQIATQFKQLFHVELQDTYSMPHSCARYETALLRTFLAHPTVTSILVHKLPDETMYDVDLSKLLLDNARTSSAYFVPDLEKYFNQGMRLLSLEFYKPNKLDHQFASKIFPGLKQIELHVDHSGVSFSWLSPLMSTHPTLNELWLYGVRQHRDVPPFISSFIAESHRRDLERFFSVDCVGLRRAPGQSVEGWYVIGLSLLHYDKDATTSLLELLPFVASSFPKLEAFGLKAYQCWHAMYDIGEFSSVLACFLSLKTLYLTNVYRLLNFGSRNRKSVPLARLIDPTDTLDGLVPWAETGLMLFSSLLAKQNLASRKLRSKAQNRNTSPEPSTSPVPSRPVSPADQEDPAPAQTPSIEQGGSSSTATPDLGCSNSNQSPDLAINSDFSVTPNTGDSPTASPTPEASDVESDDSTHMSSIRTNASGRVEYGNGKNLSPRVLDRPNYDVFDHGDLRRAIEKHAKLTKQTDLKELWRDAWIASNDTRWFEGMCAKHDEMSMDEFDKSIRSRFIGATWPNTVAEQRGRVRMKNTGAGAFADYVSEVQALNTELKETNYFFDDKQLLALLSEGLLKGFREDLIYEKLEISPTTVLDDWVTKVADFELHSKWRHSGNKPPSFSGQTSSTYEGKGGPSRKGHNSSYSSAQTRPISMEEIADLAHKSKFK
ncbi:hypothetical protein FB446DRAFT_809543 [Lentinula raphanica]|nr:hypothetical protein FB446DRAFT_809543 [Lentinula raphanica]